MSRRLRPLIALLIPLALAPAAASGQPSQPPRDRPAQQQTETAPATGRISGRVIDASTGLPMKRAQVTLNGAQGRGRVFLTDDLGSFDFTDLAAGRFTLRAAKAGYITLSYGQRRPFQPGTPLQLADGQQLKGVDVHLPRGSVIAGRVFNPDGEPMPGSVIRLLRYQFVQGIRQLVPTGTAQTDDRGQYRVWGLNPGDYYVSAVPVGGGRGGGGLLSLAAAAAPGLVGGFLAGEGGRGPAEASDEIQEAYAPTYYPGVPSAREARAVSVGLAAEVLDVDFNILLVPVSRIAGRVVDAQGAPAGGATVSLTLADTIGPGENRRFGSRTSQDGTFRIENIPPGQYVVSARVESGGIPAYAAQSFDTGGGETADLTLVATPGAVLTGSVVLEGSSSASPPDLTQFRLGLLPNGAPTFGPRRPPNERVEAQGTFTIDGVPPGSYVLRAQDAPQGWRLKSVVVEGREVGDVGFDVRGNAKVGSIRVVFTDRVSELSGTVTNQERVPVTEYTVLAFSTDEAMWRPLSRHIATARPDQNGRFQLRGLPEGDYFLTIISPEQPGEWFDPEVLNAVRPGAVRVSLDDGETKTQDLLLSNR
jgi:hypothetical protein